MKAHNFIRELLKNPDSLSDRGVVFINQVLSIFIEYSADYVCILNNQFDVLTINTRFQEKIQSQVKAKMDEGQNFLSLLKNEFQEEWEEIFSTCKSGHTVYRDMNFAESHGTFEVEFIVKPVFQKEELEGVVIFGNDNFQEKKQLNKLKESQITFKALTDNLKSAVYTFAEDGTFTYVNPYTEKLTEFTEAELKQMHFYDIVHPEFKEVVKQRGFERIKGKDEIATYEFKILSKYNQEKWVEITNTKVNIRNKDMVLGTAVDITKRKDTEEKLKVERAYLENLFENSPEAIVVTANDGIVERINQEFVRLFGYTKEEAIGNPIDELIAPGKHLSEANKKTHSVAQGERISAETVRQKKNGEEIQVSILGAPIYVEGKQRGVYGIYRDISDRVKAQEALRDSKAQLQYVLNNTKDIIFQVDLKGHFIFANKAAEGMTGYNLDELMRMSFYELVEPTYHQIIEDRVAQRIAKEAISDSFKFKILRKNGVQIWVELTTSPIIRKNSVIGIQGVARDISQRIKFEEELKAAKNKAEEADHLKSAFLANMSHEIRTPMNAILGFSRLLNNPSVSKDQQNEYIEIINSRGNHLLQVINDIIDLSKIDANQITIQKEEFNLNAFLGEIHSNFLQKFREKAGNNITFTLEKGLDDKQAVVRLDRTRMEQVFSYLLHNALKYTEKGEVRLGYYLNEGQLFFYVRDTGVGIPEHKQEVVFERFRQSDDSKTREYGGTGLGLSISKGLIELMGGDIWLDSTLGEGTVFYFSLPLELAYNVNSKEDTQNTQIMKYDWSNMTILIVEDDPLSSKFLEAILEDSNATILFAQNGQEAIDISKNTAELDLVLMDLQLPGISGNEATSKIREIRDDLPVIAQTAHAMVEDKKKSLDAGCDDYITKPINMDLLLDKIHGVFEKYEKYEN